MGTAAIKDIYVDCVRIGGLNWKLHILVDIAVRNEAWFIQAIPWSGTFHDARSLNPEAPIRARRFTTGSFDGLQKAIA
jgi:hypothetical protein